MEVYSCDSSTGLSQERSAPHLIFMFGHVFEILCKMAIKILYVPVLHKREVRLNSLMKELVIQFLLGNIFRPSCGRSCRQTGILKKFYVTLYMAFYFFPFSKEYFQCLLALEKK